jgi:uncharacterized protein with beta-barrel porin domain
MLDRIVRRSSTAATTVAPDEADAVLRSLLASFRSRFQGRLVTVRVHRLAATGNGQQEQAYDIWLSAGSDDWPEHRRGA